MPNEDNAMRAKKAPLERDVKQLIVDYCQAHHIFVRKRVSAGAKRLPSGKWATLGHKDEADLWGIFHGRHWECEIKQPGQKPSIAQEGWLNLCRSYGAIAFWCDNLEDFIKLLGVGLDDQYWG